MLNAYPAEATAYTLFVVFTVGAIVWTASRASFKDRIEGLKEDIERLKSQSEERKDVKSNDAEAIKQKRLLYKERRAKP